MNASEQVLGDLQKVIGEFEDLVKTIVGAVGEKAEDATEELQANLNRARERINDFEKHAGAGFKQGARAADRYVHENAWTAVGVAAAAAFLLGVLAASRRD